ncbi:hypothetical protein DFQ28_009974 [Apophysomyces sp. BC1034]|nr:hypothetical protein DFQ30_009541 [Apophysomyces sp. BC1015]KAG0172239.1 hypothetical protein DFQ29_008472 [Apophysomyces sp. BC1021]KAG0185088.1 hypothetical protein DFQ28_009974 [Apophysomyces sp. BC1034]
MTRGKVERKRKHKALDQYFKTDLPAASSTNTTIDQYFKKELPTSKRIIREGPGKENENPDGPVIVRGLQDRSMRKFGGKLATPLAPKGGCGGSGISVTKVLPQPRKFNVLTDDQIKQGKQFASPPPEQSSPTPPSPRSPAFLFEEGIGLDDPVQRGSSEPPASCKQREEFKELEKVDRKGGGEKEKEKAASQPVLGSSAAPLGMDKVTEVNETTADGFFHDLNDESTDKEEEGCTIIEPLSSQTRKGANTEDYDSYDERDDGDYDNESNDEAGSFFSHTQEQSDTFLSQSSPQLSAVVFSIPVSQASPLDPELWESEGSVSPNSCTAIEFSVPTLKVLEEEHYNNEPENIDHNLPEDPTSSSTLPCSLSPSDTSQYDSHVPYPVPRGKTVPEKFGIDSKDK